MNWTGLLPLAGVVVGSSLTLLGQALTDRRALRRDEIAARRQADEQRRTDWALLQRQTLLELQEHIELIAVTMLTPERPGARMRDSVADQAAAAFTTIHARLARLEDRHLAADIAAWLHSSTPREQREEEMRHLQGRLGERLRETHAEPPPS